MLASEQELPTQPVESPKSHLPLLTFVLFMGVLFLAIGFSFSWKKLVIDQDTNDRIENQAEVAAEQSSLFDLLNRKEEAPSPTTQTTNDPTNRILFFTNASRDDASNMQAHLINPDGSNKVSLDIPTGVSAFKYPSSQLVFYTKPDDGSNFYVKNLANNITSTYTVPITHPDPEALIALNLTSTHLIAPDGSAAVFMVDFFKKCPPLELPENFQGGSGACQPDPNDQAKFGYYVYNLKTNTVTYLDESITPSRWDLGNHLFYYNSITGADTGLKKVDLNKGTITLVEKAETFGFSALPLFNSKKVIRVNAETGDSNNTPSYAEIAIIDEHGQRKVIDSGKWAEIQPFTTVSPDERYVLYYRTPLRDGHALGQIHLYNLLTGEKMQLSPPSDEISYMFQGFWLDGHTFVTSADTIEFDNYYNGNKNLVKFDVRTGEMTYLVQDNTVYRFGQQ